MTRARGLHATRSSIRSDNDTSSLPERRVACRFVLFRWHRAHTCHARKCQVCDLCGPMAWYRGAYDLRALSWAHGRVWGAAGRGCHIPASPGSARFARSSYVNRALFGISTSAVRWPGSQARMTCAPCHGHMVRVWGAAGRGRHSPLWPGSAHFARSSYVNRALFGISTADEAQRCRTRLARAKAPKRPAITAQLACASGCPVGGIA